MELDKQLELELEVKVDSIEDDDIDAHLYLRCASN